MRVAEREREGERERPARQCTRLTKGQRRPQNPDETPQNPQATRPRQASGQESDGERSEGRRRVPHLKRKRKKERRVGVGWASVRVCVFSSVLGFLCLVQSASIRRVRVSLLGLGRCVRSERF